MHNPDKGSSMLYFDAFTRFGPRPMVHGQHPWRLEQLVEEMRHCSISGALVTATACLQYDLMLENLRLCERLRPYDFLFPLWNVMPHWTDDFPEPEELTALMQQHDVRAVTVYPRSNGWNLLSAYGRPLLEELQRTRTLTILDVRTETDEMELEQFLSRYPELPVLLVGVSWSRQRAFTPLLLHHRNLHIAFDHYQINRGVEWLAEHGCADQLIFASNATEMSMGAHRCYIDYAGLVNEVKTQIASGNLIRLLRGLQPPREIINTQEDEIMTEARQGKPLSTLVLDFHAHILDEGLNGAGGSYVMLDGGPRGMWALAERMGVDGIGVMSWDGTVSAHADQGNTCVVAALDAFPDTCWGLGTIDVARDTPEQVRAKMEALYADRRFLGMKPYVMYGKHYDDPSYEPFFQFGEERGLYALIHCNRLDYSEFDAMCPRYPHLTFVAAHCGQSYEMADYAIEKAQKYPNFMAEITLTPVCLGVIDYLVRGMGAERVLYGSDQPMRDPRQQFGWVIFSRLTVDEKRRMLGLNAKALLDRVRG